MLADAWIYVYMSSPFHEQQRGFVKQKLATLERLFAVF